MAPFELVSPTTLREAAGLLDADARPVSGATAVMLMMKAGVFRPGRLVSLRRVEPRYAAIGIEPGGALRIGALATLSAIERDEGVRRGWPLLASAFPTLANVRVRNVATLGGHLAHADPHMDLPPVLAALGATVHLVGARGERAVAAEDFCTGYYETVLAPDELVAEVSVPPQAGRPGAYLKHTTRSADDWPALGLAVLLDGDARRIDAARLVLGAATDRPTRLRAAEAALAGARPDEASLDRAGRAAAGEIDIAGDAHGSAAYKKALLAVLLGRAVQAALAAREDGR